ncbi:UNVERIFIED_CONTAM: hypothetical protein FKN15_073357 [Acipenser sinensis]
MIIDEFIISASNMLTEAPSFPQIFPDPVEVAVEGRHLTADLGCTRLKERLPSIVVEPTDVSEVESGELRWPPEGLGSFEGEEDEDEDLFLDQCIPPLTSPTGRRRRRRKKKRRNTAASLVLIYNCINHV